MGMLAEMVDHVIGVDTHRDSHAAAVVAARTGAEGESREVRADAGGYRQLLRFAAHHAPGGARGRSRRRAATAPGWRSFCSSRASG
jgi:hypothetical protein